MGKKMCVCVVIPLEKEWRRKGGGGGSGLGPFLKWNQRLLNKLQFIKDRERKVWSRHATPYVITFLFIAPSPQTPIRSKRWPNEDVVVVLDSSTG
jgi:hypothetical protein